MTVIDLALRLAALDPEAGRAVRVIAHFDSLVDSHAGLQSIIRGAAALAGCPAGLTDPGSRLTVRVLADGRAVSADGPCDPAWPKTPVTQNGAVLWLELAEPTGPVEAMVLERAAGAARAALERTRAREDAAGPAAIDMVLDADAPERDRLAAARRLRLPSSARAVALADGKALVVAADGALSPDLRAGIGPAVSIVELPTSWSQASLALRLTAEGTQEDPGPRVVHADDLGVLPLLVRTATAEGEAIPDLRALQRAGASAPWVLATFEAVAEASSLRDAARALHLHHSTLQSRLSHAESVLGWNTHNPRGLLRLQLALTLRRALRTSN